MASSRRARNARIHPHIFLIYSRLGPGLAIQASIRSVFSFDVSYRDGLRNPFQSPSFKHLGVP